jgi:acetyl-CoA carboxylase biotin carboxyl carrier protein
VADDNNAPSPFDVQTIKHLVALMSRHDLSEIDLRDGPARLRLRRGPRRVAAPAAPVVLPAVPAAAPAPAPAASAPREEAPRPAKNLVEIKSPGPGIFYAKPKPEAPPYVTVGSRVVPTTVVCQIEAMKLFSEINAECTGVIAEVVAEDGKPVEFGSVLFRVNPTA